MNLDLDLPIVVMSDYIIDHIIKLKSKQELFDLINKKLQFGAGAISGIPIQRRAGGKAVNVAYCLVKLGLKVTLFTISDKIGLELLKQTFSQFGDRINLRIRNGKQGYNVALEFLEDVSKINLSDIGDNNRFGPDVFSSSDNVDALQDAAAVALVDWSSNSLGTELAEYVFVNSAKALHLIDPGDMQERKKDIPYLPKVIRDTKAILSVNENEYNSILETMETISSNSFSKTMDNEKKMQESLKKFVKQTEININLHAKEYTAWSDGKDTTFFPTRRDQIRNLIGAGDSWDAANIVGYLAGLEAPDRLAFSNTICWLYMSNAKSEPATLYETIELLKQQQSC